MSPEDGAVAVVSACTLEASTDLIRSYCDAVITNAYQASGLSSARHAKTVQQRQAMDGADFEAAADAQLKQQQQQQEKEGGFFISEFGRWCRENGDAIFHFLDSFVDAILDELETFSAGPPERLHANRTEPPRCSALPSTLISCCTFACAGHLKPKHGHLFSHVLYDVHILKEDVQHLSGLKKDAHAALNFLGVEHDADKLVHRVETDTTKRLGLSAGDSGRAEAKLLMRKGEKYEKWGDLDGAIVVFKRALAQQGLPNDAEL